MSSYDGSDPYGTYCAAGRTILAITAPNDLDWTTPCPDIPSGRHVLDFRGVGRGFGKLSFCRRHGGVFFRELDRWLASRRQP